MRILFYILTIATLSFSQVQPEKSSSIPLDTANKKSTTDSIAQPLSELLLSDSADTLIKRVDTSKATPATDVAVKDTVQDTLFLDGKYAGIGIGWSLGSFEAAKIWEHTLHSNLQSFYLSDTAFTILKDSTSSDTLIRNYGDTSKLRFTVKEKPSGYNMSFPVSLSLVSFGPDSKHSWVLSFFLFSKNQKSSLYTIADSVNRRIDINQKFRLYSASLHYLYSHRVPPLYMIIDNVHRTDVVAGLGIAPLMYIGSSNIVKKLSDDKRINAIYDSINNQFQSFGMYGLSMSLKAGISTVKRIKSGALEASILYTMTWNDFFYDNGKRVHRSDLDPIDGDGRKRLSFMSNRFEISLALLKGLRKKS
ncbi:MAG: hypothetical protein ACM31E_05140 [Fibrobacterota bacterium]|nr:hypothetical protein [Chitinispirillaceae bacterium]